MDFKSQFLWLRDSYLHNYRVNKNYDFIPKLENAGFIVWKISDDGFCLPRF